MRRIFTYTAALFLAVSISDSLCAQSPFTLGFAGPDSVTGEPGAVSQQDYTATLTHAGDSAGAQGWSISASVTGAGLVSVTTDGTPSEAARSGGFEATEPIDPAKNGGKVGFVSAIVLHFKKGTTLPANTTQTIAIAKLELTIPAGGGQAVLAYEDGLVGSGQPVPNNVTQDGNTVLPAMVAKTISLVEFIPPPDCGDDPLNFGFSPVLLATDTPWEGVTGVNGAGGTIPTETALGATPAVDVYANVISQLELPAKGVQGWSISIGLYGDATLTAATTDGTYAERSRTGGFEATELIDPAKPENVPFNVKGGAVSAIVLHFKKEVLLRNPGVDTVLKLSVAGTVAQTETPTSAQLKFVDNLTGSGQPVPNNLTVGGDTKLACNAANSDVTLSFGVPTGPVPHLFIRGNPNGDEKVNIADPIWIINELFRGGPATLCPAAADVNDDGLLDSSDAVFLIEYLFTGGPPPAPPFGAGCGLDPTLGDDVLCDVDQDVCKA